ncbi:MAG: hypothetical protein QM723_24220 [Myxococcaceae bacterium]
MADERTVEDLFLEVAVNPGDLACRQVLADLLMERNDPRGEFIALQCVGSPTPEQLSRAKELFDAHVQSWISEKFFRDLHLPSIVFEHGFLAGCALIRAPDLKAHLERDWATVKRLRDPTWEVVNACPLLTEVAVSEAVGVRLISGAERPHLRVLELISPHRFDLVTHAWQRPTGIPHLEQLVLRGPNLKLGPQELAPFLDQPLGLSALRLGPNKVRLGLLLPTLERSRLRRFSLGSLRPAEATYAAGWLIQKLEREAWEIELTRGAKGAFDQLTLRGAGLGDHEGEAAVRAALERVLEGLSAATFERVTAPALVSSRIRALGCLRPHLR